MTVPTMKNPTQASRKRAAIIEAAAALLREEGFAATSMDRIALRAGVSKRTVYNHFASKEALFHEIVNVLSMRLEQEVQAGDEADVPVAERLRNLAQRKLRALLNEETLAIVRALVAELIRSPELGRRVFEHGPLAADGDALSDVLRAENHRGRLIIDDIGLACRQFSELLKGCLFWPWVLGIRGPPTEQEQQRVVDDTVFMFLARYGTGD